jgi:hypothetical protein
MLTTACAMRRKVPACLKRILMRLVMGNVSLFRLLILNSDDSPEMSFQSPGENGLVCLAA